MSDLLDINVASLGSASTPLITLIGAPLAQESSQIQDTIQVPTRPIYARTLGLRASALLQALLSGAVFTQSESFEETYQLGAAAAAIAKDEYITIKEITLVEAQALALRALQAAESRRTRAAEAEAQFIGDLLDSLGEENEL